MDKRYQVFISSTFQDLQNARQEVSQALLRADCFPAGMELFPAADEEQFEFIKQIIDQSDYYIIITAGRYGSIHPETGLSYTEMEYDYAVETGKPVIRLLHKDPLNELKGEFIEKTTKGRKKLEAFRAKLQRQNLVKYWMDPRELLSETVFALQDIQIRKPTEGWVRANGIASESAEIEIERSKRLIAELHLTIERMGNVEIDLQKVFDGFKGEVCLICHQMDESYDSKIIETRELTVQLSELSKLTAIGALTKSREWDIRSSVERVIKEREGFKYPARTEWPQDFKFQKILQRLEAEHILISTVGDSNSQVSRYAVIWETAPDTRAALSGLSVKLLY